MSKVHELKIASQFFEAKLNGVKLWELRLDDRGFEAGDYLKLREDRLCLLWFWEWWNTRAEL